MQMNPQQMHAMQMAQQQQQQQQQMQVCRLASFRFLWSLSLWTRY
jgi:hypothetical protein